ncbi:hypothetical protein, partial [Rhodopirellula bahusiensis]|uniref:hypothetical protein n=1 Tax=Rhodopirellula bahusiensis TaxID=2014065 RepID=UPI0032660BD1
METIHSKEGEKVAEFDTASIKSVVDQFIFAERCNPSVRHRKARILPLFRAEPVLRKSIATACSETLTDTLRGLAKSGPRSLGRWSV